jgi:hypothetical protein
VRVPHPLVTLSTVLLGAVIFSLAGFINAVYAKKFDDVAIVPTFILTPLTYLGGVFYSVSCCRWAEAHDPRQSDLLHGQRRSATACSTTATCRHVGGLAVRWPR